MFFIEINQEGRKKGRSSGALVPTVVLKWHYEEKKKKMISQSLGVLGGPLRTLCSSHRPSILDLHMTRLEKYKRYLCKTSAASILQTTAPPMDDPRVDICTVHTKQLILWRKRSWIQATGASFSCKHCYKATHTGSDIDSFFGLDIYV